MRLIEDQHPTVLGEQGQPVAERLWQAGGRAAQFVYGVALSAHARPRPFERRLIGRAGMRQAGQLQLQRIDRLQCRSQLGARAADIVEQLVQSGEAALQRFACGIRQLLGQHCLGPLGSRRGEARGLAELAVGRRDGSGCTLGLLGGVGYAGEAGVVADLHQQLQQRRIGTGQPC